MLHEARERDKLQILLILALSSPSQMSWGQVAPVQTIIYDTEEYEYVYSEGLVRLVQLYQEIPEEAKEYLPFPPDHASLILNTTVYNDTVCWGLGIRNDTMS